MNVKTVKCPECGADIQLSTSAYDNLASQIKEQVVAQAVSEKEAEMNGRMQAAVQAERSQAELRLKDIEAEKERQIACLNTTLEGYKRQANESFLKQQAKYTEIISGKEAEITGLKKTLEMQEEVRAGAIKEALAEEQKKNQGKDIEIASLRSQLSAQKGTEQLEVQKVAASHEKTEAELQAKISSMETARVESEKALKEKYELIVKGLNEQIEYYKDFKTKLSTKMIGESLEVYASREYEKIRPLMGEDYFDKDNAISKESRSKADFIWRCIKDGVELESVIFEMKTEAEDTAKENRHKNEDFFKELDKDRTEKHANICCLVSTLEADNELYNQGITAVCQYRDMYVLRPGCFIPFIIMVRNMAMRTAGYQEEIRRLQNETIDVSNFEAALSDFKTSIGKNYELALKKKNSAVARLDKIIDLCQQIKADFESMDRNLLTADHKAQKMTIKRLTRNSPSVAELIDKSTVDGTDDEDPDAEPDTEEIINADGSIVS